MAEAELTPLIVPVVVDFAAMAAQLRAAADALDPQHATGEVEYADGSRSSGVIHATAEAAPAGAMCGNREDNYRCRRVVGHNGLHDNGGGVIWSRD